MSRAIILITILYVSRVIKGNFPTFQLENLLRCKNGIRNYYIFIFRLKFNSNVHRALVFKQILNAQRQLLRLREIIRDGFFFLKSFDWNYRVKMHVYKSHLLLLFWCQGLRKPFRLPISFRCFLEVFCHTVSVPPSPLWLAHSDYRS